MNTKEFIAANKLSFNTGTAVKLIVESGETAAEKAKSYQEAIEHLTEEFNSVATEAEQAKANEKRATWRKAYYKSRKAKEEAKAEAKVKRSTKKASSPQKSVKVAEIADAGDTHVEV